MYGVGDQRDKIRSKMIMRTGVQNDRTIGLILAECGMWIRSRTVGCEVATRLGLNRHINESLALHGVTVDRLQQ